MAITLTLNSFNAGEITPYLYGRTDFGKYASACKTLSNMRPLRYGAVQKRRGFSFCARAKHDDRPCRLIRFQFSADEVYLLEFGDHYVRFFKDGAQVCVESEGQSVPYEVATCYAYTEIFALQWVQSLDVVYLVHKNHPPSKLSRFATTHWTFETIAFSVPPFLERNDTDATLALTETDGVVSLVYAVPNDDTAGLFTQGHVGAYFSLEHRREDACTTGTVGYTTVYIRKGLTRQVENLNTTGQSVYVKGDWSLSTSGTWDGSLLVERSFNRADCADDDTASWEVIRVYTSNEDRNIDVSGTEEIACHLRVRMNFHSQDNFRWEMNLSDYYLRGLVRVLSVQSAKSATVEILEKPLSREATARWYEGAWSAARGFPSAITFYQKRLFFGGSYYEPQTVWGSQIDDYENFETGTLDTDAIKYTVASETRDNILWLAALDDIAVGTSGGEWRISGSDASEALSPTNVKIVRQSTYGSGTLGAQVVNDVVIFAQRDDRCLRELRYSFEKDGYNAADLTMLAEHIAGEGFVDTAYQQRPESVVWCVRADGVLAALTYDSCEDVRAWSRHETCGRFLSVETMPSATADGDEVWAAVARDLPSGTRIYIECMQSGDCAENLYANARGETRPVDFLDGAVRVVGQGLTFVDNLAHLEGMQVSVVADGGYEGTACVRDGRVDLRGAANDVRVGLPYAATLETLSLEVADANGSTQNLPRRLTGATIRFYRSGACRVGMGGGTADVLSFRDTGSPVDEPAPLFTGIAEKRFGGATTRERIIRVQSDLPEPLTVLSITAEVGSEL